MATKRMFDKAVIDTDRFMDLSMSSKALYFLLGMDADDEGFVSYKKVIRVYGGNEDDIKLLILKNFVIGFKSGVVVITDWNKNNWLDSRRIRETEYQKEKSEISLTNKGEYVLLSNGLANAKIEENSIEENSIEENSINAPVASAKVKFISKKEKFLNSQYEILFEEFWKEYPEKKAKGKAYESWVMLKSNLKEKCIQAIKNQNENNHFWKEWLNDKKGDNSYPHATTWLNQKRWDDEVVKIIKTKELETIILISKK